MDRQDFVESVKKILRPIVKYRFLAERVKFARETILSTADGNAKIAEMVHRPGAAGKIGGTEIKLCRVYLRRRDSQGICRSFAGYEKMASVGSGIYPDDPQTLSRFCEYYLKTLGSIDLLAVWFKFGEAMLRRRYAMQATLTLFHALGPFWHDKPWSAQLAGKRVVVVSPFEKTIYSQYARRKQVWAKNPDVLPEFELYILRCPQLAGIVERPEYPDWFAALDALKQRMSSIKFDVAIVGAGAWSLPLVVHAKELGAFGIHLGGETQILFGIKGRRWDNDAILKQYFNETWVRPDISERPAGFKKQENGCYW